MNLLNVSHDSGSKHLISPNGVKESETEPIIEENFRRSGRKSTHLEQFVDQFKTSEEESKDAFNSSDEENQNEDDE